MYIFVYFNVIEVCFRILTYVFSDFFVIKTILFDVFIMIISRVNNDGTRIALTLKKFLVEG